MDSQHRARVAAQTFAITLIAAAVYLGVVFVGRSSSNRALEQARLKRSTAWRDPYGVTDKSSVRILQFYVAPGAVMEGQAAALCYGVANAKRVSLDPPVESLTPSYNRCLAVQPRRDTRYTLTVEGSDGRKITASVDLKVRPDPANAPRILFFSRAESRIDRGRTVYSLCYETENTAQVSVTPPVIPATSASRGCFYVAPEIGTTYTLRAEGPTGRAVERRIVVEASAPVL